MLEKKVALTYKDYLRGVQILKPEEQISLIEILTAALKRSFAIKRRHSILEIEGLGLKIWKGIDAQEYINKERESWD